MKNINMLFAFLSGAGIQEICLAGGNASKEVQAHEEKQYVSVAPLASSSSSMSSSSYSAASSSCYYTYGSESKRVQETKQWEGSLAPSKKIQVASGGILCAQSTSGRLGQVDPKGVRITCSKHELQTLKKQFDDLLSTPDGSNKRLRFDYKHIFNTSNRCGKHVGHYDPKGEFSKAQKKASRGVFPQGWTPYEIMAIIKHAYTQRANSNNGQRERKSWVLTLNAPYDLKIKLVFGLDKNGKCTGKVKTAYPV